MTAVSLGDRPELPDAIKAVIEAVRAGELDLAIEEVAEKSIPDLTLKNSIRALKQKY
ncbi:hypothetical protein KIH24_14985 [Rhizobiales bacterium TNE-4]|nr:hypothetical protein [Rhizobiales bacterium TNE-4]MBV1828927.1 hypothetical protein [Rhizobiales bacterium TNE-4]